MFKRKFVEIDPKLYKGVKILAISRGDTIRETVNNCLRKTYNLGGGKFDETPKSKKTRK